MISKIIGSESNKDQSKLLRIRDSIHAYVFFFSATQSLAELVTTERLVINLIHSELSGVITMQEDVEVMPKRKHFCQEVFPNEGGNDHD